MRCLKLIRSLILGDNINDPLLLYQNDGDAECEEVQNDHHGCRHHHQSCLLFLPTHEIIHDTSKLAAIARDMGMDFMPDASLTNILFSWPSSSSLMSSSSSSSPTTIIPLPFPHLSSASTSHLRCFARISKGLFMLVSCDTTHRNPHHHHCPFAPSHTLSLFSCLSGDRVEDMEAFSRLLTGNGWALFKTIIDGGDSFVFRKVVRDRVRWIQGEDYCRVRELRLPTLDFPNAVPLPILHYILLMTDGLFYLA